MKRSRLCIALALLLALAAGCAAAPASRTDASGEDARVWGEGGGSAIRLEGEPPVSRQVWETTVTPGFRDTALPEAYLRAREVFRLFRGDPAHVEDFPREDGTWYEPGTLSREIGGTLYYRAWNRYENWTDFAAMVRSVFTDDYADQLLAEGTFRELDGTLWYAAGTGQPDPDYLGGRSDNFRVSGKSEGPVQEFTLLAHYNGEAGLVTRELPIRAVYTGEEGWRFDRFDDPAWTDRTYTPVERVEYSDLTFLDEAQQAAFTAARRAADDYLFGYGAQILELPGNRMGETFTRQEGTMPVPCALVEGTDRDFDTLAGTMQRLFTDRYLEETGFAERYWSEGGQTATVLGDGGTDLHYTDSRFDTYRLLGTDGDTVNFLLVAHYASPQLYEEDESFIQRRDSGDWDYQIEYPVRLVNTPEGWRLDAYTRPY